jgi:outer membrane protein assembly factor BamB
MNEEKTVNPRRTGTLTAAALAACLAAAGPVAAGEESGVVEWPEFHGPRRDNRSPDRGLLKRWPEGGPRLIWKSGECGRGYAGVSIAGGLIFTSGDFTNQEMVVALDLEGKPVWRTPNGAGWKGATPGSRSTPTYSDGVVYQMNPTGRLAAYRARTGKELWAVDLREVYGARFGVWAMSENVIVEGKALLCAPGGPKGTIVALDRATGAPLWVNREIDDRASYCSPIVVEHNGVRQMVTMLQENVVSVDVRNGKTLWSYEHRTPYNVNVTMPRFVDGQIFISSGYAAGSRLLKIAPDSRSVKLVWATKDLDNCHGGVSLVDGYLYGSGCRQSKKGLVCVELSSGKTMWTAQEMRKASPTYADGMLYCVSDKGTISLLKPDPERCQVVSQFELPRSNSILCLAHPVVYGGRFYIRHWTDLYAYDVKGAGG